MDLLQTLEVSLSNLRSCWPHAWPGLEAVFWGCLTRLDDAGPPDDPRIEAVYRCARDLSSWLEADGEQRRRDGVEPSYHNRLHTADTMVGLTLLLQAQRRVGNADPVTAYRHERLALLAMMAHDLLHDGCVNAYPAQLEARSAQALTPLMQQHGVHEHDQRVVRHLILNTDPQSVRAAHAAVAHRCFAVDDVDCLAVLVQEADILASTLPGTGPELTRHLSQEWERSNPSMAPWLVTAQGRLQFLERSALFSSPASLRLGIPSVRQAQIDALHQQLAG